MQTTPTANTPKSKAVKTSAKTTSPPTRESVRQQTNVRKKLEASNDDEIVSGQSYAQLQEESVGGPIASRNVQFQNLSKPAEGKEIAQEQTAGDAQNKQITNSFSTRTSDKATLALGKYTPTRAYVILEHTRRQTTTQWFFKKANYDVTRIKGAPSELNQQAVLEEGKYAMILTVYLEKDKPTFVLVPKNRWTDTIRTQIGAKGAAKLMAWMRAIDQAIYDGNTNQEGDDTVIVIIEEDADPTRIMIKKYAKGTTIDILWDEMKGKAKILALNPSPIQTIDKQNRPLWTCTTSTTAVAMTLLAAKTIKKKMQYQDTKEETSCVIPLMPETEKPRFATMGMILAHMFRPCF